MTNDEFVEWAQSKGAKVKTMTVPVPGYDGATLTYQVPVFPGTADGGST